MTRRTPIARRGRPSLYDEDMCLNVLHDHAGAATNRELADALGVSGPTLVKWVSQYPALKAAVAEAKARVDDQIVSALAKRAQGYSVPYEETVDGPKGLTTKSGETHIPADVGAAKFWLTNRRRDEWSERKVVEVDGTLQQAILSAAEVLDLDMSEWEDVSNATE